jgi:trehalose synthase
VRITDTSDLWWKNAVVYCLDLETFMDWNGDGSGDLEGLAQRVDYLSELGITCLWLMPFYPSGGRDDGYDIEDFYGVDPRFGDHGDLVEVIRTARDRGIRVIADVVVNHTSDQHPWFQDARTSRDAKFRDYYVWVDKPPAGPQEQPVFPDAEKSVWQFDQKTKQYYLHHFYKQQPDLNITNPAVRDFIAKMMGFWLEVGLSGFRIDAVPFLLETMGENPELLPDPHAYLRSLRKSLSRRAGDAMLLGEVNVPRKEQVEFFGGEQGDELNMQFDFVTMQNLYLSLARADARPLAKAVASRPPISPDCQWATFVRNHDELILDKLSEKERQEVFEAFGPDPQMQLYGRGLRRRLPNMLDGDQARLRMVYSLLFSLPGTPVLFYGEEIGLGENLDLKDRQAVRTPMQWSNDPRTGGFSTADDEDLIRPLASPPFGPEHVNVQDQRRDPDSMLRFVTTLIQRYRQCPELGWGDFEVLDQPHKAVLAHRCTWDDASLIALHNLSDKPVTVPVTVEGAGDGCKLDDLLRSDTTPLDAKGGAEFVLDGYGFRWLRLVEPDDQRLL